MEQSTSDYCREGTISEDERTHKVFVFVSMSTVIPENNFFIQLTHLLPPSSGRIKFQELTKAYFREDAMWGD